MASNDQDLSAIDELLRDWGRPVWSNNDSLSADAFGDVEFDEFVNNPKQDGTFDDGTFDVTSRYTRCL